MALKTSQLRHTKPTTTKGAKDAMRTKMLTPKEDMPS